MNFNFVDEEEDSEDQEFLDLSELTEREDETVPTSMGRDGGLAKETPQDSPFMFEDEIPEAQKLTSPEVKTRAKLGRKRRPAKMDYKGKRKLGWSMFCSHKDHLPNLCERDMTNGTIDSCTCPCHKERGYVQPEPQPVSGGDDEDFVLLIS